MPTDEKFIECLRKIKESCQKLRDSKGCLQCKFFHLKDGRPYCQFRMIATLLDSTPKDWDVGKIERIIKL